MQSFIAIALLLLLSNCAEKSPAPQGHLVWSDEFDYTGLPDSSKWSYDTGGDGWGNNELQYYTANRAENARVENGLLVLEARKEAIEGRSYSSARLVSRQKGDWQYGMIEVRAQLPQGRGIWPAIWMLPTDWQYGDWPRSGEIDIMEFVGYAPDSIYGSVHTESFNHVKGTQSTGGVFMPDQGKAFHVYAIAWEKNSIRFFFDGREYHRFDNNHQGWQAWPFDQRFHLLLNIAVGGNWGGKNGIDENIFPQRMLVDYVRVYQ